MNTVLEREELAENVVGRKLDYEYIEQNRKGDHICYISDLSKIKEHFPGWDITLSLEDIFHQIARAIC